jgi:hypothetical protein
MLINGYKYTNEQDAIDAREQCDAYYGIPVTPDDVTQNWVDYNTATLDNPIFLNMAEKLSINYDNRIRK